MGIWERLRASRVLLRSRGHFSLRGHRIEIADVSYHSRLVSNPFSSAEDETSSRNSMNRNVTRRLVAQELGYQ